MKSNSSSVKRPQIGVSSCLLGNPVRFDGGHKKNPFILDSLSQIIDIAPVCPEVEAGFGIPRPAIQLRLKEKGIMLVESRDPSQDLTEKMHHFSQIKVKKLSDLDGFIFKKNSPSCGLHRVPIVINQDGYRKKEGRGIFAQCFTQHYPLIPVEEEGRLNDVCLRENFFERVYAYQRWKSIPDTNNNVHGFITFHAKHKLMLMARGSNYYQELGRMVSDTTRANLEERREAYINRFMQVMAQPTSPGRQVNVLQHIMGYLKKALSKEDKQELLSIFEAYRQSHMPLITAVILIRHHLRKHPQSYMLQQHYLEPYPEELALRS